MPFTFPINLFNPTGIKLSLVGRAISGPDSLSGVSQVVKTDGGGYWRCDYTGINLTTSDQIRAWRAWEDYASEGVGEFLIPVADIRHAPRGMAGNKLIGPGSLVATGDDSYFPETLSYASPTVIANASSASLRATQLTITVTKGTLPRGGQYFSINHGTKGSRMYRTGLMLSRSGQTATIKISPPLREAIGSNTPLDFDFPSFLGGLVPNTDVAAELLFSQSANVSISFRESL